MKIRKINIDDLEALRDLSIQTFKETFARSEYRRRHAKIS